MKTGLRCFAVAVATLLAAAPAAWAVEAASSSTPPGPALEGNANSMLSQSDREFLNKSGQGAAYMRQLAVLAVAKSGDPRVKQYAQAVVTDLLGYKSALVQVGENNGTALPSAPEEQQRHQIEQLETMTGKDFSSGFVKAMRDFNQEYLDAAAQEETTTWNPLIHDFLERFKPMQTRFLQDAQALQTS